MLVRYCKKTLVFRKIAQPIRAANFKGFIPAVRLVRALSLAVPDVFLLRYSNFDQENLLVCFKHAGKTVRRVFLSEAVVEIENVLDGQPWPEDQDKGLFEHLPAEQIEAFLEHCQQLRDEAEGEVKLAWEELFEESADVPLKKPTTRQCTDPWQYLEMTSKGDFKPCCKIHHIAAETYGDPVRRDSLYLRALRNELLTGVHGTACATCGIRRTVAQPAFERQIAENAAKRKIAHSNAPWPVKDCRIEFTAACNLRCVYCNVTRPGYDGRDMADDTVETALSLISSLPTNVTIHCNGHGETTYHKDWKKICRTLVDQGRPLTLITNLAKVYDEEEIDLLSKFRVIQVSLDSSDKAIMKAIRKPTRVEKVFDDIARIRAKAVDDGRRPPILSISAGLYDPSIWGLEAYADEIIRHKISSVTFWNLVKYKHNNVTRALSEFSEDEFQSAREIVRAARTKMDAAGVRLEFAGDFIHPPTGHNLLQP